MSPPDAAPLVVVTGASRGIGRAAALAFARAGWHVVAVARTQGALEELDDAIRAEGGAATLVPLDLKDVDGIDRLGAAIHARWGRLDTLIGNAGLLGPITPVGHITPKEWDDVFAVNVTANWRLIRTFDPLLRAAPAGRVVIVSSGAAHKCLPYWGAYSMSKAAVEAMTRTYAGEMANTAVRVMLVNPGPLRTRMRASAVPGEDPMTLKTPDDLAPHLLRLAAPDWTETGRLFDFPTGRVLAFQPPV